MASYFAAADQNRIDGPQTLEYWRLLLGVLSDQLD